ncbi:MAG: protein kinase [Planctomycetes bacterium]|nr:protein kinase [Planctomycetota bacterium]
MSEETTGEGPGGDSAYLGEILAALDRGEEVDLPALLAAHPGKEAEIRRLLAAARSYFASVRSAGPRHPAQPALRPGDRLGDFEVESFLGGGGGGEVFVARQRSLGGRRVALKVLPPALSTEQSRTRFEREALLLSDLHHPHLAEVHGFGVDRGLRFLAMRLVEGVNLRALLGRRREADPSPPDRGARRVMVRWIREVSEALAIVHDSGLVHRDVKPSNVIVEESSEALAALPDGKAVLVDFGLVRRVVDLDLTRTGQAPGTKDFAPPEQLAGQEVDARADVFALGATLHDLLAGRLPAERRQASAGLEPLEELVPDVDRDLFAIVRKAVELDPSRRYPDAGALAEDLGAWESGGTVSARRQGVAERIVGWARRHPRRILRGAALSATVLLAGLGLQSYGRWAIVAGEVRASHDRADLLSFYRTASALPGLARLLLIREPDLRRSLESLSAPEGTSAGFAVDAYRRLQEDDLEGALLAAASDMRVGGPAADPLLARFLLAALRPGGSPGTKEGLSPRRSTALRVIARLLYERPAEDPQELERLSPFRAAILEVLGEAGIAREDRLFALTALSGCGAAEDVPVVLGEALAARESSEERRLGLACAERLLRRAHQCGHLMRVDVPALADRVKDVVRRAWDGPWYPPEVPAMDLSVIHASMNLASAIAFAARDTVGDIPWRDLDFSGRDRAAEELPGFHWSYPGFALYVLHRLPRLLERMRTEVPWRGVLANPYSAGYVRALSDDPGLDGLLAARLRDPEQTWDLEGAGDAAALFERGRHIALAQARGDKPPFRLDEDTLLGCHSAGGIPEARFVPLEAPPAGVDPPPWAAWDFSAPRPSVTGAAREALALSCDLGVHGGSPFLRMWRFGESELEVRFVVSGAHAERPWGIELTQGAGTRTYYPFSGEVYLEIRVDRTLFVGGYRVSGNEPDPGRWMLPRELMTEGEHELSIRLGRRTTTTYGIARLGLKRAD